MSPEAAIAWQGGRQAGYQDGQVSTPLWVRARIDRHVDASLPWTEAQAFVSGYCVGLAQALAERENDHAVHRKA